MPATPVPPPEGEGCTMSQITDEAARADLLNRLKRAEGQLRGIQRMIEEGQPCLDIASQMAAVRKALDSTYVRMTVCFMQQEMQARLGVSDAMSGEMQSLLDDVQTLLGKVK
jgi:DNA-binding FrmR family transcriptional regulator